MTRWIARYEEGFITRQGLSVTLENELRYDRGWCSPEQARRFWRERAELVPPLTDTYGNGMQQLDDVRHRSDFVSLGVTQIWRRVTFVEQQIDERPTRAEEPLSGFRQDQSENAVDPA